MFVRGTRLLALLALTALLALAPLSSAPAADLPYLFDQLKKPAYRKPLEALLGTRGFAVPFWLKTFMRNYNGVAAPGEIVRADGQPFEFYSVCQPHNCSDNALYVLYAPGGGKAWALVMKDGAALAYLGEPGPALRKVLGDAMGGQ